MGLSRVLSGMLSTARGFTTASEESAEFLNFADPEEAAAPPARTEAHRDRHEDPPKGGNVREAPIGIAADWLTGVWKQCAAGLPAAPHSPDGN